MSHNIDFTTLNDGYTWELLGTASPSSTRTATIPADSTQYSRFKVIGYGSMSSDDCYLDIRLLDSSGNTLATKWSRFGMMDASTVTQADVEGVPILAFQPRYAGDYWTFSALISKASGYQTQAVGLFSSGGKDLMLGGGHTTATTDFASIQFTAGYNYDATTKFEVWAHK